MLEIIYSITMSGLGWVCEGRKEELENKRKKQSLEGEQKHNPPRRTGGDPAFNEPLLLS